MAVSDDYRDFVLEQLAPAGRVTSRACLAALDSTSTGSSSH
jgi:TfoX/Sxy family transcriptional regulator of competence genes